MGETVRVFADLPWKEPIGFKVGDFAMLHPGSLATKPVRPHPDAGRIGRIERLDDFTLWVCFRDHAQPLFRSHRILPKEAWIPLPRSSVEETSTECGARTWSHNKMFSDLAMGLGTLMAGSSAGAQISGLGITPELRLGSSHLLQRQNERETRSDYE